METIRGLDEIHMDFGIGEEFKEIQAVEDEEAHPQKVMLTEGEEDEDDEFLEREEGKQFDEVEIEASPDTRRSLINGGEND
jgi:hypothetical protein